MASLDAQGAILENDTRTLLLRQRVVSALLGCVAMVAVAVAVSEYHSSAATPQTITGEFTGFDMTGTAMAFQPTGSSTAASYAWAPATSWQSANGSWHLSGPATCLQPSDRGRKVTIGVVTAKSVGAMLGADLIVWVKC
jgi:hypothetical protein